MKCYYKKLLEEGLDPYAFPYDPLTPEDWRHMIDNVWASKGHQVRH